MFWNFVNQWLNTAIIKNEVSSIKIKGNTQNSLTPNYFIITFDYDICFWSYLYLLSWHGAKTVHGWHAAVALPTQQHRAGCWKSAVLGALTPGKCTNCTKQFFSFRRATHQHMETVNIWSRVVVSCLFLLNLACLLSGYKSLLQPFGKGLKLAK